MMNFDPSKAPGYLVQSKFEAKLSAQMRAEESFKRGISEFLRIPETRAAPIPEYLGEPDYKENLYENFTTFKAEKYTKGISSSVSRYCRNCYDPSVR